MDIAAYSLFTRLYNPGSSYHFCVADMSSQVMLSVISVVAYVLLLQSPVSEELLLHKEVALKLSFKFLLHMSCITKEN